MSAKFRLRLNVGLAIATLWTVLGLAIGMLERQRPSPERVLLALRAQDSSAHPATERDAAIRRFAHAVNQMELEEKQRVFLHPALREFVSGMSDDEKRLLLDLTTARGFAEAVSGFDTATSERRLRWLIQASRELDRLQEDTSPPHSNILSELDMDRIAETGLTALWQSSDLSARFTLRPLLDQLQSNLQIPR